MIILSIDSSTPVAGIAVSDGKKLLGEVMINTQNTHSEKLMPMVAQLLHDLQMSIQQIDAVAITCGPGSFTGLRIGMATAKGIVQGGNKKLIAIPTLDTLAQNLNHYPGIICPIMNAQKKQVYTAIYKSTETGMDRLSDYQAIEAETLASLPVQNVYGIYYYLMSDEWQNVENLDMTGIHVTEVSAYWQDISVGFLEGELMVPENGSVALMECVAIEKIRMEQPTAFSNINYEMLSKNNTYTQVRGVNMAEAIYKEVYDVEGVRYKLCYEMDKPNDLKFVTAEIY